MAQPLYFLPYVRSSQLETIASTREVLKERGLKETFADVPHAEMLGMKELAGRGPGELPGTIIGYQSPSGEIPRRVGYYPNEQEWTPAGDGQLVWIGVDSAEPPTPDDMRRKHVYGGYEVELADGQRWTTPTIRRLDGTTDLPKESYWDATGKFVQPVKRQYQAYWEETAKAIGWLMDGAEVDPEAAIKLAIRAIGLNYRYTLLEHNVLRFVDGENYLSVLSATTDYPRYLALQAAQKKIADSSAQPSSTAGATDASPTTTPAVAS